ncbi:MAG: tetratricopeptide repeat protein [Rhizobiales bacterium]|nr:tetratricopeptide repeat protein [Hyphomicrobiales bacterium]
MINNPTSTGETERTILLPPQAGLTSLLRLFVRTFISAMVMVTFTVSVAFAGVPDAIKQRFEFQDSFVPKLGVPDIPSGSKPWTEDERASFLHLLDRAYDLAPNILRQVVLYRPVRVYRAKDPRRRLLRAVASMHGLVVPDLFLHRPSHIAKKPYETMTLGTMIHESVHLLDSIGSIAFDKKWQALVLPRMEKVRNYFRAKGMGVMEAIATANPPTEYDYIGQAQGLPTAYSAETLGESLAEVVEAMLFHKNIDIPSKMQAFVKANILQRRVKKEPAIDLVHQALAMWEKGDLMQAKTLFKKAETAGARGDNWAKLDMMRGGLSRAIMRARSNPFYLVNANIYYTRAIKAAGPEIPEAFRERGRIRSALGLYKEAIEDFSAFLAINPNAPKTLFLRATAYKGNREWRKALIDFDKVISLKSGESPNIYQGRAEVRLRLKDAAGTIEDVNKAIGMKGGPNAQLYYIRGRANRQSGKINEAITDFSKAIELKKDFIVAQGERAEVYLRTGRFEEAATGFETIIDLEPKSSRAYAYLGEARYKQKKWDQAETAYSRALELARNNGQKFYVYLRRAGVRYANRKFDDALKDLDSAVALKPDSVDALTKRGFVLLKLARYDQAIRDYEIIVKKNPRDLPAIVTLAKLLEHRGDKGRAKILLQAARQVDAKKAKKLEKMLIIRKR